MAKTKVRYEQIRVADVTDDQKTAAQILVALGSSATQEDLQEFVLSQIKRIIWGDSAGNWYSDFVGQNIPSLAETDLLEIVPFTYATPSPMGLRSVLAGNFVIRADVLITTTFNGAGAGVQFGTSGAPGMILGPGDVAVSTLGQYDTFQMTQFPVPDLLELTIAPGAGATQGAGLLLYRFRR